MLRIPLGPHGLGLAVHPPPPASMVPEPGPAYNSTPDRASGLVSDPGGSGWVAAALCVVIALTAAANSLLIALICTQPALRSTSNFFLVSLFTSDLLVGLVVMPPAMLNALYGRWVLARDLCLLWAAFDVMCCSASILNLCLISLDRYLLILSPLRYKLRMTPVRALALVLGAWTLAALASFLPLQLGWHELGRSRAPAPGQCRLLASLPFVLVASGLTFFLPSGAICFTYCRILLAARKQALQVASLGTGAGGRALEMLQVPGAAGRSGFEGWRGSHGGPRGHPTLSVLPAGDFRVVIRGFHLSPERQTQRPTVHTIASSGCEAGSWK